MVRSCSSQSSEAARRLATSRSRCVTLAGGDAGVSGAVERVRQSNLVDILCVLVLDDLGIDEEGHRHLDAGAGGERLLFEAETFDLGEVPAGKLRHDVEY